MQSCRAGLAFCGTFRTALLLPLPSTAPRRRGPGVGRSVRWQADSCNISSSACGLPAFHSLCSPFGVRERAMVLAFNLWHLAREFWHIGFAGVALLLSVLAS